MTYLPTVIGEVLWLPDQSGHFLEIIICDCDDTFDPRLWIGIDYRTNEVFDDHPHTSPNYR